jgi:tetratricopeptide (TPR) repeat protein
MRKTIVPCLFAFVLLNLVPVQSRAEDRYYLLLQARAANDAGEIARANSIYQDYLAGHPAVTGRKQGAFKKNPQYYLSTLLRAAGDLIDLQRASGDFQGVGATLALLERVESDNFFGSKNRYTMATLFEENGDQDKALKRLRRIVEEQIQSPLQGNNKVFLRTVARLVTYCQEQGAEEEILSLKEKLKNSISVFGFDIIDREQIGSLLLNLGEKELAEQVLSEIVFQARGQDFDTEEHAVVRALTKLLKLKGDNLPESGRLMASLDEARGGRELTPANQYALGLACLNGADPQRGLRMLKHLTETRPEAIQARKAMFVLGRAFASSGDWEQAIRYYGEYVVKYPEPRFFSLKAYSRLIDRSLSRELSHFHAVSCLSSSRSWDDFWRFRLTTSGRLQLRHFPDQRSGQLALAAA